MAKSAAACTVRSVSGRIDTAFIKVHACGRNEVPAGRSPSRQSYGDRYATPRRGSARGSSSFEHHRVLAASWDKLRFGNFSEPGTRYFSRMRVNYSMSANRKLPCPLNPWQGPGIHHPERRRQRLLCFCPSAHRPSSSGRKRVHPLPTVSPRRARSFGQLLRNTRDRHTRLCRAAFRQQVGTCLWPGVGSHGARCCCANVL